MSVRDFFKSLIQRFSGVSVGGLNKNERRYFNRCPINDPSLMTIKHNEKGSFKVHNLSYQGALIEGISGSSFNGSTLPTSIELISFGTSMALKVFKVEQRDGTWVIHFEHDGEGSIQNLGSFVEPIRCGNTAVSMPTDPSKILAPGMTRVRFFGDGPFDILIEKTNIGNITFVMATIRRGVSYGSVTWNNGTVHTQKSIDNDGVSARMGQTQELDQKLVWTCAMACLGLNFPDGPACAKILADSLISK